MRTAVSARDDFQRRGYCGSTRYITRRAAEKGKLCHTNKRDLKFPTFHYVLGQGKFKFYVYLHYSETLEDVLMKGAQQSLFN